jgi:VWFA-related protein
MLLPNRILKRLLSAVALLCLLLPAQGTRAQQPGPTPSTQTDEVLRINAELVQTDVMVFDKGGRFIDGLQREQFELRVDGKPQPISFFDRITAGSASEEAQLAAARGTARPTEEKNPGSVGVSDRGRVVIFFIDDLHLAFDSLKRAQKTLLQFIDEQMRQNDQVAIASTSGQIGFLQQLTDNKTVLRLAVSRLKLQPQLMTDGDRPPMSEYLAQAIVVKHDGRVMSYFMEPLVQQGMPATVAEQMVGNRAQRILQQSHAVARNTFISLESLARTVAPQAGRKLVFFISDGFLLNSNDRDIYERLSSITNVAARNGVVIYTIDGRGLATDSTFDATTEGHFDPTGRIASANAGELTATQETLRQLAADTGGRALLNTNAPEASITRTLKETATYYIIAWRPDSAEQKSEKLRRIEVKIKGRPELTVQVKRGFLAPAKETPAKALPTVEARSAKPKTPVEELRAAIGSFYPNGGIPTALALDYLDSPQGGPLLTISMQVPASVLAFDTSAGKARAELDVGGYVYNDKGQTGASFEDHLSANADSLEVAQQPGRSVFYTYHVKLAPGLYQVRVAARDTKSGRIGSASRWVEIPDLKSHKLTLSSLLVGELTATGTAPPENKSDAIPEAQLNVSRRFARTSRLRFLTFIYNAARGASGTSAPDVAIQIQIMRDDQPVMTTTLRKVATEGLSDLARLPYAADIPLDEMRAGRYLLQVTVIDRSAKTSASQQVSFEVE